MKSITDTLKLAFGSGLAALSWSVGGFDMAIATLMVIMTVDFLSGITCACMFNNGKNGKSIDSKEFYRGGVRKIFIFCLVAVSHMLDAYFGVQVFRTATIGYYIANEALSFIENLGKMNVPIPAILKNALEQLRNKDNTGTAKAGTSVVVKQVQVK